MINKIKTIAAVALVGGGIAVFYMLADRVPLIVRVLAVLLGLGLSVVVALTTPAGRSSLSFFRDSLAEARRVVWPTRKETLQMTAAVFVLVMLVAIFLGVVDAILIWAVSLLMGRGA